MKQVILHIPHSSSIIPFKEGFLVDDKTLNREILKLTDWYTDELFHSEVDIIVKAEFSRIFCDPERFPDDSQELMAQFGMGVLYVKSDDGKIIRQISTELRQRILNEYYWQHHKKLNDAVNRQLEINQNAVIIDCHSFPDIPLHSSIDKQSFRPDFNIGTDSYHTPKQLIDISVDFFNEKGYSLGVDSPYSGSIVPLEYYHKSKDVQSIMLEVNRKLYLNEPTNEKSVRFNETKTVVQEFIDIIKYG
jgi:N-formylglutamate deformylase